MLKKLLIPVGIVALLSLGSIALAGIPCSGTSTLVATENSVPCTNAGAFCPKGDFNQITVTVTVKDCYGTALAAKPLIVSPATPGFKLAAAESAKACTTNVSGQASVIVTKIGGCGNLQFTALCQGVPLGPSNAIYCSNVDSNASGKVDGADLLKFAGDYGKNVPCSDFDCSAKVDGADLLKFANHYGHQ
jgi:hypothetical protein